MLKKFFNMSSSNSTTGLTSTGPCKGGGGGCHFSTFWGNFSTFNDISFHTSPSLHQLHRHLHFKENNFFRLLQPWFSTVHWCPIFWQYFENISIQCSPWPLKHSKTLSPNWVMSKILQNIKNISKNILKIFRKYLKYIDITVSRTTSDH